ncbi:MAG: hypothetical protein A2Y56_06150 [Candidatus Aminicenantes bacterium RBG_13_63_10]|nr:MAG: hypothetical protein A2Y56_06150 [Candidatus Aminicenantes bacterium RBG_13_63_10]
MPRGRKRRVKTMNVKKLTNATKILKEDLGEALIATDIWATQDGQSIVGINTQPQACALFNRITNYLAEALKASGFPELGRYYFIDLAENHMVVIIPLGTYQWGILLDTTKMQLGLLLNVVLPNALTAFTEAAAE